MHGCSNADIGGVVSLPERPNHTTRMVRPRGVLEIMHYCLITRVHTTTHLSRHHATAPRTSWRFGGSSSCLDESSHPWVPAGHPQCTGASTEEGFGWLSNTQRHQESKPPQWISTFSLFPLCSIFPLLSLFPFFITFFSIFVCFHFFQFFHFFHFLKKSLFKRSHLKVYFLFKILSIVSFVHSSVKNIFCQHMAHNSPCFQRTP